jgi:uncharacterized protein
MNRREFVTSAALGAAVMSSNKRSDNIFAIDSFCHFSSLEYFDLLLTLNGPNGSQGLIIQRRLTAAIKELYDINARLKAMDDTGVDISILTSQPFIESAPGVSMDPVKAIQAARFINDYMAKIADDNRRAIKWVAQLPVNLPSNDSNYALMIGELKRCLSNGAVGGCFTVSPTVKPPDHPDFVGDSTKLGLFGEAARLNVPLWMHPVRPASFPDYQQDVPPISKYTLHLYLGWLLDESVSMVRIAFANAFGKYPDLKIICHHRGALIPLFQARISYEFDRFYNQDTGIPGNIGTPYLDHFRKFYVDTSTSADAKADASMLKIVYDFFGADHVLFGSDAAFSPGGGRQGTLEAIESIKALPVSNQRIENIFSNNILKLLQRR